MWASSGESADFEFYFTDIGLRERRFDGWEVVDVELFL